VITATIEQSTHNFDNDKIEMKNLILMKN